MSSAAVVEAPSRKRRSDTAVVNAASSTSTAGLATASTGGSNKGTKLKVRIKRYHGVSQWVWGKLLLLHLHWQLLFIC